MWKRPLIIFLIVTSLLTAGMVWFIQTTYFAGILKKVIVKFVPLEAGVNGDFKDLAINLIPPGISIQNPALSVKSKNIFNLPENSIIQAEKIVVSFHPFQMFSRNIKAKSVTIIKGNVQLAYDSMPFEKKKNKKTPLFNLKWDQLLRFRTESVRLEDTHVKLSVAEPGLSIDLNAHILLISQWESKIGLGYESEVELRDIKGDFPKKWNIPKFISNMRAHLKVNEVGLFLEDFYTLQDKLTFKANGNIKWDSSKGILAELKTDFMGELESLFNILPEFEKNKQLPHGVFIYHGEIQCNFDHFYESLKLNGSLSLKDVLFNGWKIDQIKSVGSWISSPTGGEVSIASAELESPEVYKRGGVQSGFGGKVSLGSFKFKPGNHDESVAISMQLENSHLHWFAAPKIDKIYPLDFRASGPIQIIFQPGKKQKLWSSDLKLKLNINELLLDNQHLGKTKPVKKMIMVPAFSLEGGVRVDGNGIVPQGLSLVLPDSKFQVVGKVEYETGFDLFANGPVSLKDIKHIGEIPIDGNGSVSAHIHGPTSRTIVDFDVDLKNAYYLSLKFGDVKGRITYDEDADKLFIQNVLATQGTTVYSVNGLLDFGKLEKAALDVQIQKGKIQDFILIFEELTSRLWWFPKQIRGEMSGNLKVQGGLSLSNLEVVAQINGNNWEYFGERFKQVTMHGGYDKGKYYLESFKTTKRSGLLFGKISYDNEGIIDWKLESDSFTANELNHIAKLDVPIRGKVKILSKGGGKEDAIESNTRINVTEVVVRGVSMPSSFFDLGTSKGILTLKTNVFDGQGIIDLSYNSKHGANSSVHAFCKNLDFSTLLLLLNPKSIIDTTLSGTVSGGLNLNFKTGDFGHSDGKIELIDYTLAKTGSKFKLSHPFVVKINNGTFPLTQLGIQGKEGEAILSIRALDTVLDGVVTGNVDASVMEFFTSTVSQASGLAQLDFVIAGTVLEPSLFGKAELDSIRFKSPSLESPFENVSGVLQLKQNILNIRNFKCDLAQGQIFSNGMIKFYWNKYPSITLDISLYGNKLKIYPFQYIKTNGKLHVAGETAPYLIDGSVIASSALSKEKILGQNQGVSLKTARFIPPASESEESDAGYFNLDINATAEKEIFIKNELFDAELSGEVKVINTIDVPRILGSAEVVQGKMLFKDKVFQIQSGTVQFENPTVINPKFSLTAVAEIGQTKVQLFASGTMSQPKIELTSNPAMLENEILSLLTMGLSSEDVKKLGANDRSTVEKSEAFGILLNSLDFNRDIQNKTGFEIQLDESVNPQTGNSVFRPRTDTDSAVSPKIVIKKKIGKKLELSVGSTVGVGTGTEQEVNAELQVTPNFSVNGVWDSLEGADAKNKTSYGLDLKLQKKFK